MTQVELIAKIQAIYPGAQWSASGDPKNVLYADICWLDTVYPKPSAADLGL